MNEFEITFDIEEEFQKNVNLKREDVNLLRRWIQEQSKYPEISDFQVFLFLHSCYYDIENTKSTINSYYEQRAKWPEAFQNRNPLNLNLNVSLTWPLKHETKEGYTIVFSKLMDFNSSNYEFHEQQKIYFLVYELWLRRIPNCPGFILILDAAGVTWGHLSKFGLMQARKLLTYVQEAFPIRLKSVHFINVSPIVEKIFVVAKLFMKKELYNMTNFHSELDSLYKFIPKKALPENYGGADATIEDLHKSMMETLQKHAAVFANEGENDIAQKGKFSYLSQD